MPHVDDRLAAPPTADVLVRWAARLWSIATIALVLAFIIGEGINPSAAYEWVGLIFFPLGVCAGMIVAWRNEAVGGGLSVASFALFYVVALLGSGRFPAGWAYLVFAAPGFLFLLAWALSRPRPPAS